MAPKTKAEWTIILDLFRLIREAGAEERQQIRDLLMRQARAVRRRGEGK
jgi:hypothetical protein